MKNAEGGNQEDSKGPPANPESRESEALFRVMSDAAPVLVRMSGTDKLCTFFNKPWLEFTGRTLEQELGNGWAEGVHADDFEQCLQTYTEAFDARRDFRMEYRLRRHDGEYRWVLDTGVPRFESSGGFAGYIGSCVDITENKQIEQLLRKARDEADVTLRQRTAELEAANQALRNAMEDHKQTEGRLRAAEAGHLAVLRAMPDLIFRVNRAGEFLEFFPGAQFEPLVPPQEFLGKTIEEVLPPAVAQPSIECLEQVFESAESRVFEYELALEDETTGYYETRFVTSGPDEALIMVRDITAAKQAEKERERLHAQLQHAQKLESLGVLAGGIAHDFNNLLMGVLGNAEIALLDLASESPAREELQAISAAAKTAAELTKQMLAYSGKGKFVVQPLNLSKLVEDMAHLLEISISKKVALKYNFAENLPPVEADAAQIRQIVMNLIINASEAVGEKSGVITVTTGVMEADQAYLSETYLDESLKEGYYVYLEVADTGRGMDQKTIDKIFDPFFTTKFTGRGLGLAAVLGIVRGHSGALKVYSQPKRGTTFKVLFPCSEEDAAALTEEVGEDEAWRGSGTILVVDDEEHVRAIAKKMIERGGFTVITASDGGEAVELFRARADEIVLVLLDLMMPHLDGEETFRELRRIRSDVKAILSSGYNEQEVTSRFVGKGLAGFIQKPYGPSQLLGKVREALDPPDPEPRGTAAAAP